MEQQQEQIQVRFKMLDDVFHIAIIALERLERFLAVEESFKEEIQTTAMLSDRDWHDDKKNPPTRKSIYGEMQLQCTTLYFQTQFNNKETFEKAQKYFLKDLLEWYAGRAGKQPNDVERFFVPFVGSLSREITSVAQIPELVKKYVCDIDLTMDSYTDEQKEKAITDGYISWLLAQHKYGSRMKEFVESGQEVKLTEHRRGEASEGYHHLRTSFAAIYEDKTPLALLDKLVSLYLPELLSKPEKKEVPVNQQEAPAKTEEPEKIPVDEQSKEGFPEKEDSEKESPKEVKKNE